MTFMYEGQINVVSKPGGWGIVPFPMSTMEKPLAYNRGSPTAYLLQWASIGTSLRQPDGYDRWIDTAVGTTAGKYHHYEVLSSTVEIRYMPETLDVSGSNIVVATLPYFENADEPANFVKSFANGAYSETDLVPAMRKGGIFQSPKVFNTGHLGHKFKLSWNKKTQYSKFQETRPSDPKYDTLFHTGLNIIGDADYKVKNSAFLIGQLGSIGASAKNLNFIVKMRYNVRLSNPTQFGESEDGVGGQF